MTVDTTLLDIVYHDAESLVMDECIVTELYPNTATYKAEEFTTLPHNAKGRGDANECAGLAEVNTIPMDGSPSMCHCTRIAMDGPYAAGAVVKCKDCHDV